LLLHPAHHTPSTELDGTVPKPTNEDVEFDDIAPAWAASAALRQAHAELQAVVSGLLAPAKRASLLLQQLRHQAVLADAGLLPPHASLAAFMGGAERRWGSMTLLHKQVCQPEGWNSASCNGGMHACAPPQLAAARQPAA
jgi:hypothetical protein